MDQPAPPPANTPDAVAIIGVGLIGGSIAAAVKHRCLARRVIGVGRNESRLRAAQEAGLIDTATTSVDSVGEAELVVVCTPVDRIATDVLSAAAHLQPGSVLTDAGSVKAAICHEIEATGLPEGIRFVGSHPLAGSHKNGWEHADAELFEGRVCVVTPVSARDAVASSVLLFWERLGMRTVVMTPGEHDQALAATSHVPHVAAAGLSSLLNEGQFPLAATGFRDTTRIAAGDPDLWTAILISNAQPVSEQLSRLLQELGQFRDDLNAADAPAIRSFLANARTNRDALDGVSPAV